MKTVHVTISGSVQGVGFRQFVKEAAEARDVRGWVGNKENAMVEAVFQGSEESIKQLFQLCRKGPFLARVRDVKVEWRDSEPFKESDFEIIS